MEEIRALHAALKPVETLFVVDAMQGQDAVNVAQGVRRGAAAHRRGPHQARRRCARRRGAVGAPRHRQADQVRGVGEKLAGLEPFHPERMASRILGMGDMLSLVEEARRSVDLEEAEKLAEKVKKGKGFDLEDFKEQLQQMKKMGGLGALMDKLPAQLVADGAGRQRGREGDQPHQGHHQLDDAAERAKPELIKASRKRRIAAGAGVPVQEVNRLLNQFEQMQKMMKMMSKGGMQKMMRNMKGMLPGMR